MLNCLRVMMLKVQIVVQKTIKLSCRERERKTLKVLPDF